MSSYLQYGEVFLIITPQPTHFIGFIYLKPLQKSDSKNPKKTRPDNTRVRLNSGYPPWKDQLRRVKSIFPGSSTYMDYLRRLGEQFLYSRGKSRYIHSPYQYMEHLFCFCLVFFEVFFCVCVLFFGVENPNAFWGKYILYLPPLPSGRVLKVYP